MSMQRLQHFPITAFSMVMGLSGLSIALSRFHHFNWLPQWPFFIALGITFGVFTLATVLYTYKIIAHISEVKEEFTHRIKINFFSAISISFLLISVATHGLFHQLSEIFWWIGMVMHAVLMLKTISFWILHNFEIKFFNPAWFIPVVGNIVVPIMGVEYAPIEISYFFFSVGFFFYIILFTIFLNRVIFHHQMPKKFVPTFFILLAPPAVGFVSYFKITGNFDFFAMFLVQLSYFFVLLLLFLNTSFRKLQFFISWWAFTFPLAAITIASVLVYSITEGAFYKYMAWLFLGITTFVILLVSVKTISLISKGGLCVAEEE